MDPLGATKADVEAQQRAVSSSLTAVANAIDQNKTAFGPGVIDQWNVLAHQALAFASETVGYSPFTLNDQHDRGKTILLQLAAWEGSLTAMGIAVQRFREVPAPPPPPSERTFFGSFLENLSGETVLLLLAAFAFSQRSGR